LPVENPWTLSPLRSPSSWRRGAKGRGSRDLGTVNPVIATLSLAPRRPEAPSKFRCEFEGIYVEHRSPEHRLARKLIEAGYPPDSPYQTIWDHGTPSLKSKSLRGAAGWEVEEPTNGNLRLVRWRERELSSYSEGTPEAVGDGQHHVQTIAPLSPTSSGEANEAVSDSLDRVSETPNAGRPSGFKKQTERNGSYDRQEVSIPNRLVTPDSHEQPEYQAGTSFLVIGTHPTEALSPLPDKGSDQ